MHKCTHMQAHISELFGNQALISNLTSFLYTSSGVCQSSEGGGGDSALSSVVP